MTPQQHWLSRVVVVVTVAACLFAEIASADLPGLNWSSRAWQVNDGLPNNFVVGTAQTPDGYLWVGTRKGLVRFDGVEFEVFALTNLTAHPIGDLRALAGSRMGGLWVATDRGIVLHLNGQATQVITNGVPDSVAETLIEDGEGALWVAFRGGMVCRIKDGEAAGFAKEQGLPTGGPCSFAVDAAGRLWFAKAGSIGIYRDGRFHTLLHLNSKPAFLGASRAGGVWICSGLKLLHYDEEGPLKEAGSLESAQAGSTHFVLHEDRGGTVWIGADNGLHCYNGSGFERVVTSDRQIQSLMEDRKGALWVGTGGGGLNRVRPQAIHLENADNDPSFDAVVESLCEDSSGVLWAATRTGQLARRTSGGWRAVPSGTNWSGGAVTCVVADGASGVWIGTREQALHHLQEGKLTSWRRADGLTAGRINTLLNARSGDVWIGGELPDALECLRAGELKRYPLPPEARGIRAMAEDAAGNIWVAAGRAGRGRVLVKVSGDRVTDETKESLAPAGFIRWMYTTSDGSIWFGGANSRLVRLKDGRCSWITEEQGLYDTVISQMVADDHGWLWFGSDHGLFKVRQDELDAVADGRGSRVQSVCYFEDGLSYLQGNNGIWPGATRTRDGRLWIPMRTSLAVVDPKKSREDLEPPPVLLTRITVDDQIVARYGGAVPVRDAAILPGAGPELRLPPGHRRAEFGFTELSFGAPENVRFLYQLEGYDERWREAAGVQRGAGYSRLPAGDYRFRVKARSDGGVWNEAGAVAFIVTPFLWQTWWFRLAAVGGFTSAVIALARYVSFRRLRTRVRALEQQAALDRERARIARDLHDDLGTRLTELGFIAQLEPRKGAANGAERKESELIEGIRSLERDLDMIVWAVNPKNDSLDHLAGFICQFAAEFFERCGIRCRFDFPDPLPSVTLTPELRHHLFLAAREATNNTAKHSGATMAKITIAVEDGTFHFRLEDDGRGFSVAEAEAGQRNGLKNMRARIQEAGGNFDVQSEPGKGTFVAFSVDLKALCPSPSPSLKTPPHSGKKLKT